MSKLSTKTLLIIFFFLLIGIIVLWKFILPNQKVSAEWWNDNWHYRQAINISSHNTNESNVYIIASVNIGTTTKTQADDGDFRFITQNGDLLPYYISSGTGTTNVTFHIQFSSFPSSAQTIYAYYGNSTIENGFSVSDFSTQASNYTIGSLSAEEIGGGPIAYWKFDEGVGTTAYDSAGFYNGTLTGSTLPTWIEAKSNTGIAFSGVSDYVSIPYKPNFREAVTVSIWMKRTTGYNQLADVMFLSPPNAWYFYDSYNSGSVHGDVYIDGVRKGAINVPVPFDGNWYHITYTYDSATHFAKMYKNGVLYQSVEITGLSNYLIDPATGNLYSLGRNSLGRGMILDEPKIYNYARTADQIKQDYNSRGSLSGSSANLGIQSSTAPSLNSKLIAHYKFDEKSGNTTYDSANKNNTGTITGAIWSPIKSGIGLSFDGSNDYITLSSSPLDNATVWSITTKLKYINKSKQFEFFLGKNDNGTTGKILLRYNGNISFRGTNGTYYNFSITSAEINNLDTNLSFISNGTDIKLYINGIYKSSITPASTSMSLNIIGNAWSDTVWQSVFLLDELKIYNSALTDDEVKQDYNQGSAISFGSTTQTIGGTTTSLEYCIPGDTSYCASPVAEYNFEENIGTTATDTSGNNNTGTISGASWTLGQNNKGAGLNFDGTNDFVQITNSTSLQQTGNYTLETWFKPKNNSAVFFILKNGEYGFKWNGSTSALQYYDEGYKNSSKTSWNLNQWYHLSMVKIGTTISLYIDGKFDSTNSSTVSHNTGYNLEFGRYGTYFSGSIDGVKIYNYARSPAQIAYDYNKGAPIAHWKLDECQGSIANDSSGVGNTGVIIIGSNGTQNSLGTCQIGTSASWTNGAIGKINSSLNLDGSDDYIGIPQYTYSTNASLSTWVKGNYSNGNQIIIGSKDSISLGLYNSSGNKIIGYSSSNSTYKAVGIADNIFINDQWNHLVVTFDNLGDPTYYCNGKLLSTSGKNYWTWSDNVSYIGKRTSGSYFKGQVDDVRIYNYALTSEQVKQIYNGGAINFN